jgi:hypothetical protein
MMFEEALQMPLSRVKSIEYVKTLTENTKEIEPSDDKSVFIPKH